MQDFAHQMRWLVDECYPEADLIRITMDQLNTHKPASLYQTFAPEEARRILRKLEFHYTPKHGSWLKIAEIELSVPLSVSAWIAACLIWKHSSERSRLMKIAAMLRERTIDWQFNQQGGTGEVASALPINTKMTDY